MLYISISWRLEVVFVFQNASSKETTEVIDSKNLIESESININENNRLKPDNNSDVNQDINTAENTTEVPSEGEKESQNSTKVKFRNKFVMEWVFSFENKKMLKVLFQNKQVFYIHINAIIWKWIIILYLINSQKGHITIWSNEFIIRLIKKL